LNNNITELSLQSVGKEVSRLHREILCAAHQSLNKAIRIGELLYRAKTKAEHGAWLTWLRANVNFSERTAQRYMSCYERRVKLKAANVVDLQEAYALLCLPMRGKSAISLATKQTSPKTTALSDLTPTNTAPDTAEDDAAAVTPGIAPSSKSTSYRPITRAISPAVLERDLKQAQIKISAALGEIVTQISRQAHAAWPDFAARLIAHGNDVIKEGERLQQ
jgi:hypothetical protein